MADENLYARHADPANMRAVAGSSYLGRIRSATVSIKDGVTIVVFTGGIDLYDETSLDLSAPFMTVAQGLSLGGAAGGGSYSGVPLDNLFCTVTFSEPPNPIVVEFEGVHFAWFEYKAGEFPAWSMIAVNGITMQINGATPFESYYRFDNGDKVTPNISTAERLFAAAIAPGLSNQSLWVMEYQACDEDDPDLDDSPGIRSAWNLLASNCCKSSGGEDDDTAGDPDPGDGPPPGDCWNLPLNCQLIVRQCHSHAPFGGINDVKVWCFVDGQDHCKTQTGGRCFCDQYTDIAGANVPDPAGFPVGTIIFVRCGSSNQPGVDLCSKLPTNPGGNFWCDP